MTNPRVSAPACEKVPAVAVTHLDDEGGRGSDGRLNEIVAPPDAEFHRIENVFHRTKIIARSGTTTSLR